MPRTSERLANNSTSNLQARDQDLFDLLKNGRLQHERLNGDRGGGVPTMLPWPTGTATLETRQKIYGNLVERYTGIRFMITVVKRSEWVLNEDGLKQWQERFGAHNPLDFLRIQQPHLSEELDKFYYSFSVFRVYHVSEWLRHIGQRRRSFIRRLHVWTGQYQIRNKSSELLRVVEQFADLLQQHKGVSDFQLSARLRRSGGRILATPSCPACEEDAPLLSPLDCAIEILGLEPIHLVLEIPQLHGLTSQDALAMVLRSLAPTDLENISPGKAIPNITATPALTPNAPRVNFLNTLPPELRLNIFSELCSDLDDPLNTYRKSPPWIRSPKTYAVSRQFIKEFGDAWCKRYPLHFRLEPRTFSNIYTVLSFVGSQILSHAKGLRFNYEFDLVGSWNYAWHIELVWLINALCSLSKKPDSPRTVSVILTELRPDQDFPNEENSDSIYSGQKSYWGGFEGVREDEFDGLFSFQAEFLVTPDNETAPPFHLRVELSEDVINRTQVELARKIITHDRVAADISNAIQRSFRGHAPLHGNYVWGELAKANGGEVYP